MRPESYREKSEAIARECGFEPIYAPMIKLEGVKDDGFELLCRESLTELRIMLFSQVQTE